MHDQAETLRDRIEHRDAGQGARQGFGSPLGYAVSVISGKGGVGKSHLALNLGVCLTQAGYSVCVVDVSLGLGHLDLLCGLNGYWNLSHVISGTRTLKEILIRGPLGMQILPGGGSLIEALQGDDELPSEVFWQFRELEQEHQFIILDTGVGLHPLIRPLVLGVDLGIVVTTPEPTSIADAYALIKNLCHDPSGPPLELLVNQAETSLQARETIERIRTTTQNFLHTGINSAGYIPRDSAVGAATYQRVPFRLGDPLCEASRAVEQLARRLCQMRNECVTEREPLLSCFGQTGWRSAA
ncbi:MAG: P-loop NTPase [Planctomycetales bacterium]